jgi:PRTRC genetic system protein B
MVLEKKDFDLSLMIAIYERTTKNSRDSEIERFYLESHEIFLDSLTGKPTLREGRPIKKATFEAFQEYFTDRRLVDSKERIMTGSPLNYLHIDMRFEKQQFVWYCPPAKRKLFFSKDTKVKEGDMWCPGLIFYATKADDLRVWAVKDSEVTNETKLYNAPFLNVYSSGDICLGDASRNKLKTTKSLEEYRTEWENIFFLSKFSHGVGAYPTICASKNIHALTRKQIANGKKFPMSELMPHKEYSTFEELIDNLDQLL